MSRPKESEPIMNVCLMISPSSVVISPALPGTRSRLPASNSVGSTVPSQGAAAATNTSSTSTLAPMRTDQFLKTRGVAMLVTDPRVEKHVRQVDQQVDHHVEEGKKQDHALDGRKIARQHRIHGQAAQARD